MDKKLKIYPGTDYTEWSKINSREIGTLWMRGYAFEGEEFYEGRELSNYVKELLTNKPKGRRISYLEEKIPHLNGAWALIYKHQKQVFAAVDRMRSIPLFYGYGSEAGKLIISDDASRVYGFLEKHEIDEVSSAEYLVLGYVTTEQTLIKGIKQLQPGHYLEADASGNSVKLEQQRYWGFGSEETYPEEETLQEILSETLNRIFERYSKALKGKKVVIPLSGGLDSRLIGVMLKKYGVDNVICFSYGREGNRESEISKSVAEALGYEWHFIPYTEFSWYEWWDENEIKEYLDFAANFSSLPIVQDWPATKELLRGKNLNNAVFVPGHTGDFISGGHIPEQLQNDTGISWEDIMESIFSHHYNLWDWREKQPHLKEKFTKRIEKTINQLKTEKKLGKINEYQKWELENRQAKYIINSNRVYEFVGESWMIPLWDYELIDFFERVPLKGRYQQKLYNSVQLERIYTGQFDVLGRIPSDSLMTNDKKNTFNIKKNIKSVVRDIFPEKLKNYYALFNKQKDPLARYGRYLGIYSSTRKRLSLRNYTLGKYLDGVDGYPDHCEEILEQNANRHLLRCSLNGLNATYYLRTLLDS